MAKRVSEQSLDAVEQVGSGGALSRSLDRLTGIMSKGRAGWLPSDGGKVSKEDHRAKWQPSLDEVADDDTEEFEPEVAKRGEIDHGDMPVMGGNPPPDRVIAEDDPMGGYDSLDEEKPRKGSEGRVKRARTRGKAQVPKQPAWATKSLAKSGPPMPDSEDEDDGPGYDDDDEEDMDYGDQAPGQGQDMDPRLESIMELLAQNPQVMAMLEQALTAQAAPQASPQAPDASMMPAPPAAGMGAGGPPPSMPPQQLQRSMSQYAEQIEKALSMDPRAEDLATAIDASPSLEALTDHFINGFARTFAAQDNLESVLKSYTAAQEKRMRRLESMVDAIGELTSNMAKSMKEQNGMVKSMRSQPVTQPNPGVVTTGGFQVGQQQPAASGGRDVPINPNVVSQVLFKALRSEEDPDNARQYRDWVIQASSSDFGAKIVVDSLPTELFNEYRTEINAG